MYARTFPMWPEGKFHLDQTYDDFFLHDLPFESEVRKRKPAGRFNHWRRFHLRDSPDGTTVLFVRAKLKAVLAFAQIKGGHHGADEYSIPFADGKPPTGYFVVDPTTIVLLGVPIDQDRLPWKSGRTSLGQEPRPLDLSMRQTWFLPSAPALETDFLALAELHAPRRPTFS
jgi:hypothetical protein